MLIGTRYEVYPSGNALAAERFIREALKYCDGRLKLLLIILYGLRRLWRTLPTMLMLSPFGDRSLIESVYSSFKQRTKICSITSNSLNKSDRFRRSALCWNLLIKLFIL